MAFLSNEQKAFLVSQKITLSSIFDASGLSKTEYRMLMTGNKILWLSFKRNIEPKNLFSEKAGPFVKAQVIAPHKNPLR